MASRTIFALLLVAVVAVGARAEGAAAGKLLVDNHSRRSLQQFGQPQQQFGQQGGFGPVYFPQWQEQPMPLDFLTYASGCSADHVIKMNANFGMVCERDTRTNPNPVYPPRDQMSVDMCPQGFIYEFTSKNNWNPCCIPESFKYENVWPSQAAGGGEDD